MISYPHRNGNSSQTRSITLGPARKFGREQIARELQKAAQGEFDRLVVLALEHPGPRAKVLEIVAEVLAALSSERPGRGRVLVKGRGQIRKRSRR